MPMELGNMPIVILITVVVGMQLLNFYAMLSYTGNIPISYVLGIPFAVASIFVLGYPIWVCYISFYILVIGGIILLLYNRDNRKEADSGL